MTPPKKTIKRKTCKRSKKITRFWGTTLLISAGSALLSSLPWLYDKIKDTGKEALAYSIQIAGFLAPILWDGVKFLSDKGFNSFRKLMVGMWKDNNKKTINVSNIKSLLKDMMSKLNYEDPVLRGEPIFQYITEMNELCFYVETLNRQGMTEAMYEDLRSKITEQLKKLCAEFGKIMNSD